MTPAQDDQHGTPGLLADLQTTGPHATDTGSSTKQLLSVSSSCPVSTGTSGPTHGPTLTTASHATRHSTLRPKSVQWDDATTDDITDTPAHDDQHGNSGLLASLQTTDHRAGDTDSSTKQLLSPCSSCPEILSPSSSAHGPTAIASICAICMALNISVDKNEKLPVEFGSLPNDCDIDLELRKELKAAVDDFDGNIDYDNGPRRSSNWDIHEATSIIIGDLLSMGEIGCATSGRDFWLCMFRLTRATRRNVPNALHDRYILGTPLHRWLATVRAELRHEHRHQSKAQARRNHNNGTRLAMALIAVAKAQLYLASDSDESGEYEAPSQDHDLADEFGEEGSEWRTEE